MLRNVKRVSELVDKAPARNATRAYREARRKAGAIDDLLTTLQILLSPDGTIGDITRTL